MRNTEPRLLGWILQNEVIPKIKSKIPLDIDFKLCNNLIKEELTMAENTLHKCKRCNATPHIRYSSGWRSFVLSCACCEGETDWSLMHSSKPILIRDWNKTNLTKGVKNDKKSI